MTETKQILYMSFFIKITMKVLKVKEIKLIILYSLSSLLTSTFYYSLLYTLSLYAL